MKCIELPGEYVESIQRLVAAARFRPGRAKDLSALPHTTSVLSFYNDAYNPPLYKIMQMDVLLNFHL